MWCPSSLIDPSAIPFNRSTTLKALLADLEADSAHSRGDAHGGRPRGEAAEPTTWPFFVTIVDTISTELSLLGTLSWITLRICFLIMNIYE